MCSQSVINVLKKEEKQMKQVMNAVLHFHASFSSDLQHFGNVLETFPFWVDTV